MTRGSFTFDSSGFADTAVEAQGGISAATLASFIDGDTNNGSALFSTDVVKIGFTDNSVFNRAGADILVFERTAPEAMDLALTLGGTAIIGAFLETFADPGGGNTNAYGFDLSLLGVGMGAEFTGNLFISRITTGTNPDISGIAALHTTPVSTIPLPAALPLLATGIVIFVFGGRRRRS